MPNQRIEKRLGELIPNQHDPLYAAARYSLLSPGKRLRPLLVLATSATFGADPTLGLDAACAIEMVHAYSLIHDDLPCMDDDDLRRGIPTLHKVYGEGMALLAGDYLLTYAFETIGNSNDLSEKERLCLIQILSRAAGAAGMVGGQAIDISAAGAKELDEEKLLKMHHGKTGALLTAALQFGAIIGRAPEASHFLFNRLGSDIGLAFQFLDDLLDATASAEIMGKNVHGDAAKGKPTAVSYYGIEGVEQKLQEFKISIGHSLSELPLNAPLLASLLKQNLWDRYNVRGQNRKWHSINS